MEDIFMKKNGICFFLPVFFLLLVRCDENPFTISTPPYTEGIVVLTSEASPSVGNMSFLSTESFTSFNNLLSKNIGSDLWLRVYGRDIYILQRWNRDNIIKIHSSASSMAFVYQKNIGAAVNIHDMVMVHESKAYVTQYGSSHIALFNPITGDVMKKTIDLSGFTPVKDIPPRMDRALLCNGKVYVGIQKLDTNFDPTENSSIVVIDTSSDSVIKEIVLNTTNPQGLCLVEDKLYVACTGSYGNTTDGAIEVIDCVTDSCEGIVIMEAAVQGDFSDVLVVDQTRGYAVVTDANAQYNNAVYTFNPQTKTVGQKLSFISNASGLAFDGDFVYIGDRNLSRPGIYVINPVDNSIVGGPYNTGLLPVVISVLSK